MTTEQARSVAEVEVQGNALLLRGEPALPPQAWLTRVIARKAERLRCYGTFAIPERAHASISTSITLRAAQNSRCMSMSRICLLSP